MAAVSSTVLDHLQRASIPMERLDSSAEKVREKGEHAKGERERKRHGRHETRGKCERRKERSSLGYIFFPLFLPPSFCLCAACMHLPFVQQALLQ